jgi:Protein of unknwon function (DUF3310)
MKANERQVSGDHYRRNGADLQHWDLVCLFHWDYFQGQVIKYVMRWKDKNGPEDLKKAAHFLQKYIEENDYAPKADAVAVRGTADQSVPDPMGARAGALFCNTVVVQTGSHVAPTGWVGYTFEGADANGFHFRCKVCRIRFYADPHENPGYRHECPPVGVTFTVVAEEDPTRSYVDQG